MDQKHSSAVLFLLFVIVASHFISCAQFCTWRFKSNPEDCATYYECNFGELLLRSCAPGTHWNEGLGICDWPSRAQCNRHLDAYNAVGEMEPERTCTPGVFAKHPTDCSKYLVCVHGQYLEMYCSFPLEFNDRTKNCDWSYSAGCTTGGMSEVTIPVDETINVSESSSSSGSDSESNTGGVIDVPNETEVSFVVGSMDDLSQNSGIGGTTYHPPLAGDKKIICYYSNWAWYRQGIGKYQPSDIDSSLCTHIVYAFALLSDQFWGLKPADSWIDVDKKFYEQVVALKRKSNVKVLIGLGGWNDSGYPKYSALLKDPSKIANFVRNTADFIQQFEFDGIDLDYEYPTCPQGKCESFDARHDKDGFVTLVKELRKGLPHGTLISAAVSPNKYIVDAGYDVPTLSNYLDWIGVMCYDMHGSWERETGHIAPLYWDIRDKKDYLNANYSIHYWINKGADPQKIILGVPTYGRTWTLENSVSTGLYAPARGPGMAGEYTRERGFLAYYEICAKQWSDVVEPKVDGAIGPFAFTGDQWVSFDDELMMRRKGEYVRAMGLGGAMVWALDLDDHNNVCRKGRYPLLHALNQALKSGQSKEEGVNHVGTGLGNFYNYLYPFLQGDF